MAEASCGSGGGPAREGRRTARGRVDATTEEVRTKALRTKARRGVGFHGGGPVWPGASHEVRSG
jgi:hypothetical protein